MKKLRMILNLQLTLLLFVGIALATCFATAASAEDEEVLPALPKIDMSFVTDTEYNVTQETTITEIGVVAEVKGLGLSVLPEYNWTKSEVTNIEFGAEYAIDGYNSFTITPYVEINSDQDWNLGDKIVGLKTKHTF